MRHVDSSIYILWAVIYGMMGFVLFWWLSEMTSIIFSVITSLFFMAHPACILYATLLDTTFLSAFLTLCFFYFLWRIKEGMNVSVPLLVISFLMLFFTRSIYQWPWLLLLPLSLILMRYPFRKMVLFICITGLIVGLYTTKQMYLFHLTSNSFTGFNLCNSIGIGVNYASYAELADPLQIPDPEKPKAITRLKKIDGSINYNNELYLSIDQKLQQVYYNTILQVTPKYLLSTWATNMFIYLYPSSLYYPNFPNIIVQNLPQFLFYNLLFSFPILPLLLILALLYWLKRARMSTLRGGIGLFLPVAFIVFICVVFESGENMRFKFFLEPTLFVFLTSQGYPVITQTIPKLSIRSIKPQDNR